MNNAEKKKMKETRLASHAKLNIKLKVYYTLYY